jgi:inorganic triphosphatase YgiF
MLGGNVMGYEFEMKYASTPAQQQKIAAAMGDAFELFHMETTYYDTPAQDLSARKWTLRRRLENGISVCTIKTPSADGARGEWECECDNIASALPQLSALGAPAFVAELEKEGLLCVCGARFTRRCCSVDIGEAVVELALDRGVLLGGGREIPLCEVEAELKAGSRDAVIRFAAKLAEQYGLQPERCSKFRRASALAEGENL